MSGSSNHKKPPGQHYVAGIGASAGGLEALEIMFARMPVNTGMSFVIVQHLSPDHKSMMDGLLAGRTRIPVKVVQSGMTLERDTIYLMPTGQDMIVSGERFYFTERDEADHVNLPVDTLFRSLAESYQERAIAVILSGAGSDGTLGAGLIHDYGGFVVVQEPTSCRFDSMPVSVIRSGAVDITSVPEDIPQVLVKYCKRTSRIAQEIEAAGVNAEEDKTAGIAALLNKRYEIDFSLYKPSTITRRIERRLSIRKIDTLQNYVDLLHSDISEQDALYSDILIGVTHFFRDPRAFRSLKRLIGALLKDFEDEKEIRIWIPGCATGQEAYSISMLMRDILDKRKSDKDFRIFATDTHAKSIAYASTGIYTQEEMTGVGPGQIEKYFRKEAGGRYQINPEIRKTIVFAAHNILKDPPFTKIHLVSCRNLLIYFNQRAQKHVLSLLSFSLKNKGILFLGPSETIGRHESDFVYVDPNNRILRKTGNSQRLPDFNPVSSGSAWLTQSVPYVQMDVPASIKSKNALEVLLQKYVPPSVLIDGTGNVLHVFGNVGQFLSPDVGAASLNIKSMVSGPARAMILQMLRFISGTGKPVKSNFMEGFINHELVDVEIYPLSEMESEVEYFLVSFCESMRPDDSSNLPMAEIAEERSYIARVTELEEELQFARESLQATVEELATMNEKLQASNEELMSTNEELQSINEELQSVNEEMFTFNAEYQAKERERNELAADERSIISTSGIGILFLDEDLRVRKYSEPAARLFKLIDPDYGRPFVAISGQIIQDIAEDINKVVSGGALIEREVEDRDGSVYQMRIHPHHHSAEQQDDNISLSSKRGVILTFTDITNLRSLRTTLERNEKIFENIINSISDGYFEWEINSEEIFISNQCLARLGYSTDDAPALDMLFGENSKNFRRAVQRSYRKQTALERIYPLLKSDRSLTWMMCKGDCGKAGGVGKAKFSGILIDVNEYKDIESQLHRKTHDLERSNKLLEQFAHIVSHDLKAPLRHSQNYLRFLQRAIEQGDQEQIGTEIRAIENNNKRLNNLIDDIIKYSRVTSEKKKDDPVFIGDIIENAINNLKPGLGARKFDIDFRANNLPTIRGDRVLLTQMFLNLIDNAVKYNDKDTARIEIECMHNDSDCVISVRDNGMGFDQAYVNTIFTPFKRLVTRDHVEGSGIGLSICRTVAEQHGGRITATSNPGQGSVFRITLPLGRKGGDDELRL